MNIEDIRTLCLSFENVEECLPFDEYTLVYKVYGKMFALLSIDETELFNVKCDPEKAIELRERHSFVTPGFHMNKKHWNTVDYRQALQSQIAEWLTDSYNLVLASVPKSKRTAKQ